MSSRPRSQRRREFLKSLSGRAKFTMVAAIFCIFGGMVLVPGFAGAYPMKPWWVWPLMAVFGGSVAVGYAMSSMWDKRLLFLIIPFSFLFPTVFFNWLFQVSGIPAERTPVNLGFAAVAACIVALLVTGYVMSAIFVAGEGAQKVRLSTELGLAQRIHASLVPPIDARDPGLEVYGRSVASSEMGGDLIDLVRHEDGATDLYLADVSGHGVSAGVVMGMVKAAIRTRLYAAEGEARADPGLGSVVADLNAVLESLTEPHMFATFACMRFSGGAGGAVFAMAGHPPILHFVAATGEVRSLDNESLPLGIATDERFPPRTIAPAPGDLFVLYTDGLTEAADAGGRNFGIEGVRGVVAREGRGPLKDICDALLAAARGHGPQTDDQTVLLARAL